MKVKGGKGIWLKWEVLSSLKGGGIDQKNGLMVRYRDVSEWTETHHVTRPKLTLGVKTRFLKKRGARTATRPYQYFSLERMTKVEGYLLIGFRPASAVLREGGGGTRSSKGEGKDMRAKGIFSQLHQGNISIAAEIRETCIVFEDEAVQTW